MVSISFATITIIAFIVKDSNRKQEATLLPFSDTFSCAVFGSRNISLREPDYEKEGKDRLLIFFFVNWKKGYLATFLRRIDYSFEINLRDVSDGLKYNL